MPLVQIVQGMLDSNAVTASNITDGAVTGSKIATNAITADKIAPGAVNASSISSLATLSAVSLSAAQLTVSAGTSAVPAISPAGDTNTGIFFPAADTIAFSEGGTEAIRIDSSGNVGIGSSSPSSSWRATLQNSATITAGVDLKDSGGTSRAQVGLGGAGTGSFSNQLYLASGDNTAFYTNSTERLRIDSSGNVGIGTTSPLNQLTVYRTSSNTASGALLLDGNGNYAGVQFAASGTLRGYLSMDNSVGYLGHSSALSFRTGDGINVGGTDRMFITSGGNLLVNTTSEGAGAGYATKFAVYSSTVDPHISVAEGGATLIGSYIAWHKATTGNNIFMSFNTESSIANRGTIDYNRSAGQVRYNQTSDATLKNIIGDSSGVESVNILKNTKIRDYTWKEDSTNKVNVGVVAQELYEVFKGAVSVGGEVTKKDAEGNDITTYRPWAVDKTAFTFHLVAGWQAHEKLIQELKSENDLLKSRIAALEAA